MVSIFKHQLHLCICASNCPLRNERIFKEVCNLPISQGTISNLLYSFSLKARPAYNLIAKKAWNEKVVGTDKTGIKVNDKNNLFWTWQSKLSVFVVFLKK